MASDRRLGRPLSLRLEAPIRLRIVSDLLTRLSRDRLARGEEPLSPEALREAMDRGPDELERMALTYALGLGTPRYTIGEMAEHAGLEPETASRLWMAFGFARPEPDQVAFTDGDLRALREVRGVLDEAELERADVLQLARLVGQSLARVSDAAVGVLAQTAGDRTGGDGEPDAADDGTELAVRLAAAAGSSSMASMERLLVYTWKRHLAAAIRRVAVRQGTGSTDTTVCVGFADITGFTALSERLDSRRLGAFLDRFHAAADDAVVPPGGRIVKTLGDEIMFVTDRPATGLEIARRLIPGFESDEGFVRLHVGVAYGAALSRDGDFYGSTVNAAKRLTEGARPGTALVDAGLFAAVGDAARAGLVHAGAVRDVADAWEVAAPPA
ncbi:MAG TPA: adenylate/guanylate cyclase domain-containing protein [Acidimicrobiales bacterium]|nr:adenylate/guanylate cyclase domain-containing protein [Acidimicrobiales bacterium]